MMGFECAGGANFMASWREGGKSLY